MLVLLFEVILSETNKTIRVMIKPYVIPAFLIKGASQYLTNTNKFITLNYVIFSKFYRCQHICVMSGVRTS
jgi:hypothetical protein